MKIGIFGGSFNPVHNGHIHLAKSVCEEFSLDKIYFVPSRISPHRSSFEYASGSDRLEMLRLACSDYVNLSVCDYELSCDRISYSIYTVEYFRKEFPDAELFLLIGSDMLLSFDKWYRYKDILSVVTLAVVSREKGDYDKLTEKAKSLSEYGEIFIASAQPLPVSSTEIRKKVAKSDNWTCYLNKNVVQYIRLKGLYCRSTFFE